MIHVFSVLSRKSLLKPRSQELLYRFYHFKYKIIEVFITLSVYHSVHFKLIIEYSETEGSKFIFLHLDMHHFFEKTILSLLSFFGTFPDTIFYFLLWLKHVFQSCFFCTKLFWLILVPLNILINFTIRLSRYKRKNKTKAGWDLIGFHWFYIINLGKKCYLNRVSKPMNIWISWYICVFRP